MVAATAPFDFNASPLCVYYLWCHHRWTCVRALSTGFRLQRPATHIYIYIYIYIRTHTHINKQKSKQTNKQTNKQTDERASERASERAREQASERTNKQTSKQTTIKKTNNIITITRPWGSPCQSCGSTNSPPGQALSSRSLHPIHVVRMQKLGGFDQSRFLLQKG